MSEGDYLGLKLAVVGHERLHGLKRAVVASNESLGFRVQFRLGLGVQMHDAHFGASYRVARRGADKASSRS
jgi:hypothetical protein